MHEILEDIEPEPPRDPVVEWRQKNLTKLGFTPEQVTVLSYTRDHSGNFLWHEDVARVLNRAIKRYDGDEEYSRNLVFDLLS
jgi:hypothetical protein